MTYQEDAALYNDGDFRNRATMCIREQGYGFSSSADPKDAALARGVVAGELVDIDALIAAVVTAPGAEPLTDEGLLAATQAVWSTVAAARYPQEA